MPADRPTAGDMAALLGRYIADPQGAVPPLPRAAAGAGQSRRARRPWSARSQRPWTASPQVQRAYGSAGALGARPGGIRRGASPPTADAIRGRRRRATARARGPGSPPCWACSCCSPAACCSSCCCRASPRRRRAPSGAAHPGAVVRRPHARRRAPERAVAGLRAQRRCLPGHRPGA